MIYGETDPFSSLYF